MRKNILSIALVIVMLAALMVSFTGCSDGRTVAWNGPAPGATVVP